MQLLSLVSLAIVAVQSVAALATPPVGDKFAGGYVLFGSPEKLKLLAQSAATLPVNRVWLSFARPDMYYIPGSNSLVGVGLNYNETQTDHGFAEIKQYVQQLQAGGVEVFMSMGGWDYNCWPWAYAQYSIFNYGSTTATFQSTIQKYGGGTMAGCNEANQFCYACEPPSNGNTPDSFAVFPEPANSATWKQAQAYVTANNKMGEAPVWHPELIGGASFSSPTSGGVKTVPGSSTWSTLNRDPYQDFVYMAKDLGLDGIDLDYEEFWHADIFKKDASAQQNCGNGCTLFQTVFKYSAILEDMRLNIQSIYPTLKLSTAASAAGAWAGTWWGGNLKGITLNMIPSYPDLVSFVGTGANAGGWNVMSYDLSNSAVNCPPAPASCSLDGQVQFYMAQYAAAGVAANVGYELGTPAYPPPSDASHQMPLSNSLAGAILSNTQPYYNGGFFWELFKPQGTSADAPVNALAQALCKKVLGANTPRCSGSLPVLNDAELPGSSDAIPVTPTPAGPAPVGPQPCATPFNVSTQYLAGNTVSYQGYNYIVAYYPALGTLPTTPSAGWSQQGICIAPASSTSAAPVASATSAVVKTSTTTAAAPVTTATTAPAVQTTSTSAVVKPTTAAATTAAATTAAATTAAATTAAATTAAATTAAATTAAATTAAATTAAGSQATPCYPAFVLGTAYNGAAQVSYNNVNYVSKWWESGTATPDVAGDGGWSAQGPCGSGAPATTAAVKTTTAAVVPVTSTTAAVVKTTAVVPPTTAAAQPTTAASGSIVGQVCPTYSASQCVSGTMYVCGGAGPYAWAVWYTGC
ncbi:hypothetical protein HDU98_010693 [Podochytrium sp. JEL0797]|nr:hypothetical protein HDU98_010693 [Podochytrium sp. JEL0797]